MKSLRFLIAFCQAGIVFNPCFLYSIDFFRAVELNMVPEVMQMVNEGTDVNSKDRMGYTALHIASWNGNVDLVEYLLRMGANPNVISPSGNTPLKFANPAVGRLLIQYGAYQPSTPPTSIFIDRTPAQNAYNGPVPYNSAIPYNNAIPYNASIPYNGPVPIVINTAPPASASTRSIPRVVSNFTSNVVSNTVIITNIEYPKASYVLLSNMSPQESAALHAWDTNGDNALHRAASLGDLTGVSNLAAKGVNPLTPNNIGSTPLFLAVSSGNLELVKYLVEKSGADVNQVNRKGETPTTKATDKPAILDYLKKMGGNPDANPVAVTAREIKVEEVYLDDGAFLDDFRSFEGPSSTTGGGSADPFAEGAIFIE